MITNEEARKAIEKYQKKHPLHFGTMIDVTAISSKEGADIISQTIEKISKKVAQDTDIWCICEMAKMYIQGVKPVYPVRPQDEFVEMLNKRISDSVCKYCQMNKHCELCEISRVFQIITLTAEEQKGGAE